jgi:hypothetical protein
MSLLGMDVFQGERLTPVFPVFHLNSYITMQHLCLTVMEFFNWSSNFTRHHFPASDSSHSEIYINRMLDAMEKIFIDETFDRGNVGKQK